MNNPLSVGTEKQLFVDDRFIESSEGISLNMNPPYQTGEKLVTADESWEADGHVSHGGIVREDGPDGPVVRLWYDLIGGAAVPGHGYGATAYAESSDGIHFHKPRLGLVEKEGSRENNIVMPGDLSEMATAHAPVARDDNPDCPEAERYKAWMKLYTRADQKKNLDGKDQDIPDYSGRSRTFYSADGLHWQPYETIPTGLRAHDTQPSWFWDPRIGRYVGYSREKYSLTPDGLNVRMVGYNESDDMLHWENFRLAVMPDEKDLICEPLPPVDAIIGKSVEKVTPKYGAHVDIYGSGAFRYSEAPDIYFAMLPMYYHWKMVGEKSWPDTFDVQLAVSRDAVNYARLGERQPFLRLGPEGSFYSKMIWAFPQPIRMGDELWIYYSGTNKDHSDRLDTAASVQESAITRAVMRLDGFVSADADYTGACLTTPTMAFEGKRLELNLDTSAGGSALVEIQDDSGKPVTGHTLFEADELNGNNVAMTVSWDRKSDLSKLVGQPVRLHFRMRSCRLYAFQFVD